MRPWSQIGVLVVFDRRRSSLTLLRWCVLLFLPCALSSIGDLTVGGFESRRLYPTASIKCGIAEHSVSRSVECTAIRVQPVRSLSDSWGV